MVEDNTILDETKQELAEIDERISELKDVMEKAEDLDGLNQDKRFINVILDGYLEEESKRLYGLLIDPTHNLKRDVMENLMDKLGAIRNLKQYLVTTMQNGLMAVEHLEEANEYRKQITARDSIVESEVVGD